MNSKDIQFMFSSKSDHWATPKSIYEKYLNNFYVDPCPLRCETNNLNKDFGPVKLFINPPYSDIISWVNFAIQHHTKYNLEVIMLVPARTDTKWFHKILEYGIEVEFVKGRLKFNDINGTAPFPSLFLTLKGKTQK